MLIKDIFAADITRDIAPVIYFHEQDPEKVLSEVSEYIITGGYAEGDPRKKRIQSGIHEQFVKLLRSLSKELGKKSGSDLPAVWISGFYGSGKSSFAKLLGLSLDNLELPNHRLLAEALLERDDSPRKDEFKTAWYKVCSSLDSMAVVFDIGSVAREGEQIHSAVKREIQKRLGYCTEEKEVGNFELKLEQDGKWKGFLRCAGEALNKSWSEVKENKLAAQDFSRVMHQLEPDNYIDPMSWYDSHVASGSDAGSSVGETVDAIAAMLNHRASGKTLFVVVDEVSQYIHQNSDKMLKLQSFVADLGQKLKGKVWLLATGQQKLEDNDDESNIGKLKDRFPPHLRVHLDPANIRDVVHKRLLKKAASKEAELRSLFQQHRSNLKLYGYGCESITEEDFLEVYPLLPGYIDLLMQIASSLRVRSARVKGDDYAIRGLLQLLGDLFREQNLAEKELGELITLDRIYDIQGSSLDADMQNTLTRLFAHLEVTNDEVAIQVAKVVALLELIQEQQATTPELVGKCLYQRMGMGNNEPEINQALEKLRNLGLISYSEKLGYKIQSSAGQEWQKERDEYGVTNQQISETVGDKLKELLGSVENPRYQKSFRWKAFYSDSRQIQNKQLQKINDLDVVTVDFRYLTKKEERADEIWIQQSASENYQDRIFWVIGSLETLPDRVRELARSQNMIRRYGSRVQSIPPDKQRLYFEEQTRYERLETEVKNAIAERFMCGQIYFRGRTIDRHQYGSTFAVVLKRVGESILPTLYEKYVDIAITDTELKQLLEKELSGISDKFMSQNLGIFELDAGKYQPSCKGDVPSRVLQYLTDNNGSGGTNLLQHFGGSPFGYGSDVVKACVAGLLRAGKIRIRPESGSDITSMRDPGTKDVFTKDSQFKRADILLQSGQGINAKDRNKICKFFQESLNVELDRENDAIADAVFQQLPSKVKALQELEAKYNQLPNRPELPEALIKLRQALTDCTRSRQVEDTLVAVKKHLDVLRDGIQQLGIINAELTEEKILAVRKACDVREHQVKQLEEIEQVAEINASIQAIKEHLSLEKPWRDIESLQPHLQLICDRYQQARQELINHQEQQAQKIEAEIKHRQGFGSLCENKGSYVLEPLKKARCETTEEAVYPRLLDLNNNNRLERAGQEAHHKLDKVLTEETQTPFFILEISKIIANREIGNEQEAEVFITELRERLLSQLKDGVRIRLI